MIKIKVENMKMKRISAVILLFLLFAAASYPQDRRTIETKVADLLARFPANDLQHKDRLMTEIRSLGETGIMLICDRILPAGTGDDTSARFAVESYSRYLSAGNMEKDRSDWEKICIAYATGSKDNNVKDFFIKQLQIIGGSESVEALKGFLSDKELSNPALAVIQSVGGTDAENVLSEVLRDIELPCAAAVMNTLAAMKSQAAVSEFISWSSEKNVDIRSAAFNALAQSGSSLAYPVLSKAAKDVNYRWETSGATASFLSYARNVGENGDIRTMNKICKLIISKCDERSTIQNKTAALEILVNFHGLSAEKEIFKALVHPDKSYRNAAIRAAMAIPGNEIINKLTGYFPKAIATAKPEIIDVLGNRRSDLALPLITSSLSHRDIDVRIASAAAIAKISGADAVPALIGYLVNYTNEKDQEAARTALMTVSGSREIDLLIPVLKDGPLPAKVTAIELMAWNKGAEFFQEVFSNTSAEEEALKSAAYKALAGLASPPDQTALADLISVTEDQQYIEDVQRALAAAALKIEDVERRSDVILQAIKNGADRKKLIPVLATTGGKEALAFVLKEFENGNAEMRDICFKTLTSWCDFTASSALYEIVASRNKTFEAQAFQAYLRQTASAPVPDEQKLLLYKKIMPFAPDSARKNQVIIETGKLKTYQSLFFVADYLDDHVTSANAAKATVDIALPDEGAGAGMYGTLVRNILTKALSKIQGPESDYDKERVVKYLESMLPDEGFKPIFNGKDLTGWQGLVENPLARAGMRRIDLERKQAEADVKVPANWSVKEGCIWFNGEGDNLCSIEEYADFELLVDWKISKGGDSGIYLRGSPQVQIWDASMTNSAASVGSGGLYNNKINPSKPLKVADNPPGEWNSFRIIMLGEKVSVWLNGVLVVDDVVMENYWDRSIPIFPKGPVELQAHGTDLAFRDIYIRKIDERDYSLTTGEKSEGFIALFNGRNLDNWIGNKESYVVEDGMIVIKPGSGSGGNLYTEKEYSDFILRFEFYLTPASNNGLGIRAPLEGDAAYVGMELQILDNTAAVYSNLQPYQYHGSVYGVIPARRGYLNPLGEWNYQEVYVKGTQIRVTLNGTIILDGDIAGPRDNGTMDHKNHPGLKNETGHIGFLGHGSILKFRNIRIKELSN